MTTNEEELYILDKEEYNVLLVIKREDFKEINEYTKTKQLTV